MTKRTTVPEVEEILHGYFPVLDHGFISLVDYMGTDEDVERAARVSYGVGTRKTSETRGLIRHLQRNRHTTPSEMVELKFHCSMPMFVARQWIRHRTANVNEYSGRYSLMPLIFYEPEREHFQLQSEENKQGRSGEMVDAIYQTALSGWQRDRERAARTYNWLIGEDLARELARIDLPLSTYTQWYWKIDLHNLMHFLGLRCDSHAQYEIRAYADIMAAMMRRVAPLSYEAWYDYHLCGESMSRIEMKILQELLEGNEFGALQMKEPKHGESVRFIWGTERMKEEGLAPREIREFVAKFTPTETPKHELDLESMKSSKEMMEEQRDLALEMDT